jgi:hypothetical protein
MAFSDFPTIDRPSIYSEKSERKVREFLNQETGFICRNEFPDKGCDLDVELILEGSKSSSWNFPIQIKSVEKLNLLHNDEFISLVFETSRLGYLMRRLPSMGIIIVYSIQKDKCYFEYADKVHNSLMQERESEEWKRNDKVNIHISYKNELNAESAKGLHSIFTTRFEQALKMQNAYGEKYGLPTLSLNGDFEYDFNNIDHVKKFLKEYGILLLNNFDLATIYQMVVRIPNQEIYRDRELLLVAAVAYAEVGMHADSQLFCNRLTKHNLDDNDQLMISFVNLKNKMALGYISSEDFLLELEKLNTEDINDQNRITIEINLLHYRLAKQKALHAVADSYLSDIKRLSNKIEDCKCNERTKGILMLWNAENLSYLIGNIASDRLAQMQIRQSLGNPIPLKERTAIAVELMKLETLFNDTVLTINKTASLRDDKSLKAYSLSLDVKHFINHQINYYSFDIPVNIMPEFSQRVINRISYAATAFNYFIDLHIYKEAYYAVCNMLEVIELAELGYGMQSPHDKKELYKVKEQMEGELNIDPRPVIFPELIRKKKKENDVENGMSVLKDLDDQQIESLAKLALDSFNLPSERLENIINEMNAYRMFHQRCSDPNILILQFRNEYENKNKYSLPVRFVLRSKITGLETAPSSDMNALLSSWGF